MTRRRSVLRAELQTLREIIAEEVTRYLGGALRRACLACGRKFTPRQSWHFLCSGECRNEWNRGRIRPRKGNR